jgi:ABC-type nitrate/sulfonate/bicarbonate transport system permease component
MTTTAAHTSSAPTTDEGYVPLRPRKRAGLVHRRRAVLLGLVSVAALVLLWEGIASLHVVSSIILPSPVSVARSLWSYVTGSQFPIDIKTSGEEFFIGYLGAILVGTAVGLLIGYIRPLEELVAPWINIFISIPLIALAPLMLVWFGVGLTSKVALIFLSALLSIVVNSMQGMKNVDTQLTKMSQSFCVRPARYLRTVALPSALPYVIAGWRLGMAHALIAVFVAETLWGSHGVGTMITNAGNALDTSKLMAGLVIFSSSGVLMVGGLLRLERRLARWKST